jgi:hypothetical protein
MSEALLKQVSQQAQAEIEIRLKAEREKLNKESEQLLAAATKQASENELNALLDVIASKSIGPWLSLPNPAFDGSTPLQVIERGESHRIWRMIWELGSGQPD